jgi:cytochrome c
MLIHIKHHIKQDLNHLPSFVPRTALALAAVALAAAAVYPTHTVSAQSTASPAPASAEFYTAKVLPIFQANCFRCHGGMNHRGGLSMDTQASIMKGGHDGAVLVPGHADQSLLIKLIRHEGPVNDPMPMPPKGDKISDADIATVTQWVNAGAIMPPDPK